MTLALRTLATALAAGLLAGPAAAQPGTPSASQPAPRDLQVFPLKNADAVEVARLLTNLFGGGSAGQPTRVIADPATNSLLVQGRAAEVAQVKEILPKVDVARTDDANKLTVFQLRNTAPDPALEQALRLVSTDRNKVAVDRQRKTVVVYADKKTTADVEALLNRLEAQAAGPPAGDVQVRVVWLTSGPGREEAASLPDDLKDVAAGLAKLGIAKPRLAAQTAVNAAPNAQFQATGVAEFAGSDTMFSMTGRFTDKKEGPTLQIEIRAARQLPVAQELGSVHTEITAPLGHLVVLGVAPTSEGTSVFVVQVTRPEAGKPAKP